MRPVPDRGPLRVQGDGELRLDLHGYDAHTAVELALQCAAAAWEHGFTRLTILHGSRDVASPASATGSGRGTVKWMIRAALDDGSFDPWALPPRADGHGRGRRASETSVALRPNPDPRPEADWPRIPQPRHWQVPLLRA